MQTTPDPVVQLISGKTVYWLLYIWWKISWNRWIYRIIFLLCFLVSKGCEGRAIHICILQSSYLSFHISSVKRDVQWYSRFWQYHYISIIYGSSSIKYSVVQQILSMCHKYWIIYCPKQKYRWKKCIFGSLHKPYVLVWVWSPLVSVPSQFLLL